MLQPAGLKPSLLLSWRSRRPPWGSRTGRARWTRRRCSGKGGRAGCRIVSVAWLL